MHILSIKIDNILSISNAEITFENSGLVLIEGWNYDDNRANGAGKTAIFNALSYGLYGDLPRRITSSEIVKKGAKSGFVEVVVNIGQDIFKIRRERPKKETFEKNGVKLFITQKEFESYLKLSYEQFLVSMYSAQTYGSKFLSMNDSSKKDFLLQLLNLNKFHSCKDVVNFKVKALEQQMYAISSKLDVNKSKLEAYKESLINDEELSANIKSNTVDIDKWTRKIIELQKIEKPDLSRYSLLEQELINKLNKVISAKMDRAHCSEQYKKLSAESTEFISVVADCICPYCDGKLKFNGDSIVKVDDMKALKKQHNYHIDNIKQEMFILKQRLDELDNAISKERELKDVLSKLKHKKEKEYEGYYNVLDAISNLRTSVGLKQSKNDSMQLSIENNLNIKHKIDTLCNKIQEADIKLNQLKQSINVYETVASMFSPTGAPAYILDSAVDFFNESVSTYVDMVWPNAVYQLKSCKENIKGDLTAKFSEELIISGKERSVGSLSGGEFRSLSLAVDFAVIDVLSKQFGMSLNPIVMDEPFDGLDVISRENVIELLGKLSVNRQIIVIDHMSEAKAMFSKIIRVEKKNGSSTVGIDT